MSLCLLAYSESIFLTREVCGLDKWDFWLFSALYLYTALCRCSAGQRKLHQWYIQPIILPFSGLRGPVWCCFYTKQCYPSEYSPLCFDKSVWEWCVAIWIPMICGGNRGAVVSPLNTQIFEIAHLLHSGPVYCKSFRSLLGFSLKSMRNKFVLPTFIKRLLSWHHSVQFPILSK